MKIRLVRYNLRLIVIILTLTQLYCPIAFSAQKIENHGLHVNSNCDLGLRILPNQQQNALKAGKQAHEQMKRGTPWSDVVVNLELVRAEITRVRLALGGLTPVIGSSFDTGDTFSEQLQLLESQPDGTQISLKKYNELIYNAIKLIDYRNNRIYLDESIPSELLVPLDARFYAIKSAISDDDFFYVRIPYRKALHPLAFFDFYFNGILTWEAPLERRSIDGNFEERLIDISEHDLHFHQNFNLRDFYKRLEREKNFKYKAESKSSREAFINFLKKTFANLNPGQFDYEIFAMLLWYPLHEEGIPPTLENILTYYRLGFSTLTNVEATNKDGISVVILERIYSRLINIENLGLPFKNFQFNKDDVSAMVKTMLDKIENEIRERQ